jgi:asparagine synthase (glutamine-hydrolysing)
LPGIVGIITKMSPGWAEAQLLQMVSVLYHEAFYVTGSWADESSGVYVAWVVRKDSFSDGMPLLNEREDVVLTFSGEEYPEPETARRLKQRGHVLAPDGPSYLVHLYEEDPDFPAGLNGRFQGLLTDRTRGITTLFNDRYGMHRVYYHEAKEAFYFAAESKALLIVRPELRTVNPRSLGEFVACGCVLENRSLFEGIHILPPASVWTFRDGAIERKGSYFQPQQWEGQSPLAPKQYYEELRNVFSRNLGRYFSGRERIAMSLTAGLDTRIIMAWRKPAPGSLPCYSFGGIFRDCHDVRLARQLAKVCHQSHQVIRVGDEFISRFPAYAERTVYLSDGCVGVNHSPDLYVNERAAEIAPVRMTGNYGGEVLRGVRAFKPAESALELLCSDLKDYVSIARQTYIELVRAHPLSFAVFRQAPWHHFGLLGLEQTQLSVRSPYLDNDFIRTVFRAPESAGRNDDLSLRLIADGDADLHRIPTDRGLGGDRGSVSAAISRQLLGFTFKAEYAYDYGMPQWLARIDNVFSALQLDRLFLGRHKFSHFRIWYRDALAEYVREILLDPRTLSRHYVRRPALETIVRGHLRGDRNYTNEIHKVLTLELIHRLFLDSATSEMTQRHLPSDVLAVGN